MNSIESSNNYEDFYKILLKQKEIISMKSNVKLRNLEKKTMSYERS
jgi:hypothetical protein